jgi:hypothetical protein
MAQVNYFNIQKAIKSQLTNSFSTAPNSIPQVKIEPIDDPDGNAPFIGIFLTESTREVRRIAGPSSLPHQVKSVFKLECLGFDINEFANACEQRDLLLSQVEETLIMNRFLPMSGSNQVDDLQVTGIDFDTGDTDDGFFARGIMTLETEVVG